MEDQQALTQVIKDCQKGSSQAYSVLIKEYSSRLYGYFLRTTGSTSDAEDLLQEVFLKLLEHLPTYTHENKFEHWLFRIAANLARDRGRKQTRRGQIISLTGKDLQESGMAETLPAPDQPPDAALQQSEQNDRLQQALEQLTEADREIIMLRHFSEMSFKEIAQQFDIPIGTALARVHRGLKKLKAIMNDE